MDQMANLFYEYLEDQIAASARFLTSRTFRIFEFMDDLDMTPLDTNYGPPPSIYADSEQKSVKISLHVDRSLRSRAVSGEDLSRATQLSVLVLIYPAPRSILTQTALDPSPQAWYWPQ